MVRDKRYKAVKNLIDTGNIKSLHDIFDYVPKRVVYSDLGVNYTRFLALINNPDRFTLKELITMAGLFEVDPKTMVDIAYNQWFEDKKAKKPHARSKK
jgi:hypothetical protein